MIPLVLIALSIAYLSCCAVFYIKWGLWSKMSLLGFALRVTLILPLLIAYKMVERRIDYSRDEATG